MYSCPITREIRSDESRDIDRDSFSLPLLFCHKPPLSGRLLHCRKSKFRIRRTWGFWKLQDLQFDKARLRGWGARKDQGVSAGAGNLIKLRWVAPAIHQVSQWIAHFYAAWRAEANEGAFKVSLVIIDEAGMVADAVHDAVASTLAMTKWGFAVVVDSDGEAWCVLSGVAVWRRGVAPDIRSI